MKRYIRSAVSVDYERAVNEERLTHKFGDDIVIMVGKDYHVTIHPDKTVSYNKYYNSTQVVPPKALKEALRKKYGNDLMFIDDVEKASETPIQSVEEAQKIIMGSTLQDPFYSRRSSEERREANIKMRTRISTPGWTGSTDIAEMTTSRSKPTKRDFREVAGISEDYLIQALQIIHPGKDIEISWRHYNRDKYSRVYATSAYTVWKLSIQ